ncbi:GFA family protein [Sorangium sp. So ce1078]|uniref:GFA family protein n=1 Tax=Sorangium sp. So ce1078 TaxID=3133329 RepID=UPI003F606B95
MTKGACLCGTVRYEIDGPFQTMLNCHCSMCRKFHGSAFATALVAPLPGFRWLAGEHAIRTSCASKYRLFCTTCGSAAPLLGPERQLALVHAGNLEGDLGIAPEFHQFVGSKAPWYTITDSLPQFEVWPPPSQAPVVARPTVPPKEGVTQGSCLCGDVAFELDGAPIVMMNCHCSRCRRGRSAAHATNVLVALDKFRWVRGEAQVASYKVPEALRFGVAFCTGCGGAAPRLSPERGFAVVPAGALDTDPGIRPRAHIFVNSKASWFPITGDLPQFAELPPQI